MKLKLAGFFAALAVGASALMCAPAARAVPSLELITSGTTLIIPGNSAGQDNFNGAFGSFNVTTSGLTQPSLGSAVLPALDVDTITQLLAAGGPVSILFSDTNFSATKGLFEEILTGQFLQGVGTVTLSTYLDPNNVLFTNTPATLVATTGPVSTESFDLTNTFGIDTTSPYSLTMRLDINLPKAGSAISADGSVIGVPDGGSTLAFLGLALCGIGALSRKAKQLLA